MRTILLMALLAPSLATALSLGRPFADHMVLPMERAVPLWGAAEPGAEIEIRFAGLTARGKADAKGAWQVKLPSMPASSEGRDLEIAAGEERIVLKDILVGRVWLCSGQSNMDFPLARATGGREEAAAAAKYDAIRICNLSGVPTDDRAYGPEIFDRLNERDHFQGIWRRADAAGEVSAIAWWTARLVHEKTGVPIGIVENAVGGSGTEAWLPREALESRPGYRRLSGEGWLDSEKISPWARGRARRNLGDRRDAWHPFRPGFLFESGVRPWAGFPFDLVLWYQGETNAELDDAAWNEGLIRDLVSGWRSALGQADLPFFMVQLPRIGGNDPLRRHWPEYRRAQTKAARALKGVTLVVTEDLGWDSPDVHPPDKLPVARRLAEGVLRVPPP